MYDRNHDIDVASIELLDCFSYDKGVPRSSMNAALASRPSALAPILVGGLIVGVLDMAYAIVVYAPSHPTAPALTIASGILGPAAYQGGTPAAVLGIVLHFFIALSITAIYYAASRAMPYLVDHPIPSGIVYGTCVYSVMHGLILPLSNVYHGPIPKFYVLTEFIEHWLFVGLPIAFTVRRFTVGSLR